MLSGQRSLNPDLPLAPLPVHLLDFSVVSCILLWALVFFSEPLVWVDALLWSSRTDP